MARAVEELIDRYGSLPGPRSCWWPLPGCVCCAANTVSPNSPPPRPPSGGAAGLPDSAQVRLKRMYPAASYRATTSLVQVPIPRAAAAVGSPRIRDLELAQMAADLLLALTAGPRAMLI